MKKIFPVMIALMMTSCVRFGEYNSLGFRDIVIDGPGTYTMSPIDNGYTISGRETITEESYEPKKAVVALKDREVYSLKTYNITNFDKKVFIPNMSGEMKGLGSPIYIDGNKKYEPIGKVSIDGTEYLVIEVGKKDLLLVDNDGVIARNIARRIADNRLQLLDDRYVPYPSNLRIEGVIERTTRTDDPYDGMEIIFNGKKDGVYIMSFKDFNGSGNEKCQTVEFTEDYEVIDFNNVKVKVISVTPERFEGIVVK